MSYDEYDAAMDDFYEKVGEELYPDHKAQAIQEFTTERLRSYYVAQPNVMQPAVLAYREAKALQSSEHHAAVVVFSVTAIEVFLKATLLKPVVSGLVHHESLAAIVVEHTLGQAGFDRYKTLLARLFADLAEIDLASIKREGSEVALLEEVLALQKLRNKIIHQGQSCSEQEATHALTLAEAAYAKIVLPMLASLGLAVEGKGVIHAV